MKKTVAQDKDLLFQLHQHIIAQTEFPIPPIFFLNFWQMECKPNQWRCHQNDVEENISTYAK